MSEIERTVAYGTGKQGAIMQLECLHEALIELIYHRPARDIEKSIIKDLVAKETVDWPEGPYIITSNTDVAPIQYNGMSIFEYMNAVREKPKS